MLYTAFMHPTNQPTQAGLQSLPDTFIASRVATRQNCCMTAGQAEDAAQIHQLRQDLSGPHQPALPGQGALLVAGVSYRVGGACH